MYLGMNRHNSPHNNMDFGFPDQNPLQSIGRLMRRLVNAHFGAGGLFLLITLVVLVVLNMIAPILVADWTFGHYNEIAAGLLFIALIFIALDPAGAKGTFKTG